MNVYYQVKHRLQTPTLARKFDISHWFPVVQTAGQLVMIANICWMDRLPNFLRYGAPLVHALHAHGALLRYKKLI